MSTPLACNTNYTISLKTSRAKVPTYKELLSCETFGLQINKSNMQFCEVYLLCEHLRYWTTLHGSIRKNFLLEMKLRLGSKYPRSCDRHKSCTSTNPQECNVIFASLIRNQSQCESMWCFVVMSYSNNQQCTPFAICFTKHYSCYETPTRSYWKQFKIHLVSHKDYLEWNWV